MKILAVFGTRPEAIKLQPILKELNTRKINTEVCLTMQHKELVESVLNEFSIIANYKLDIKNRTINGVTSDIIRGVDEILKNNIYNLILIQGDTVSAFSAAIAAFANKIPIVHIEAGLRTYDIYNPYPEEFYRRSISLISEYNFATTKTAVKNLVKEGICKANINLVGNTVYDVLEQTYNEEFTHPELIWSSDCHLILLTTHRRENIPILSQIYRAINKITNEFNVKILFPIHLNPEVRKRAQKAFCNNPRVHLIEPMSTYDFHNIMARCYAILTDSGGIEEEALYFQKPTLVLRKKTERLEEIKHGSIKLIGVEEVKIYKEIKRLIEDKRFYKKMRVCRGNISLPGASYKICNIIEAILYKNERL